MTAILVHYTGRVQGVGFRATARHIARGYQVTGEVRNLPDGRVELLAEGEDAEVHAFLRTIQERWAGFLTDERRQPQDPSGKYRTFAIAR